MAKSTWSEATRNVEQRRVEATPREIEANEREIVMNKQKKREEGEKERRVEMREKVGAGRGRKVMRVNVIDESCFVA